MAEQYVRRSELVRRMNEAADNGTSLYRAALDTPSAADVVEVQHGWWVNIIQAAVDTTGDCDQCHCKSVWRTREMPYVICPHCGAKMDGGVNDAAD